jgi:HD-GYP domain-containing protein (c-di-GMP phosphodiesterase class II)
MNIARNLNHGDDDVQQVCMAALFHDIGKIGVPEEILTKPGPLNEKEWTVMKLHPVIGSSIIRSMDIDGLIVPTVQFHQERYNGSGYPEGLKGEDIPWGARVLAVVDAYDAMVSDRVYRKALGHENAMQEITTGRGKDFDPDVIDAFLKAVEEDFQS